MTFHQKEILKKIRTLQAWAKQAKPAEKVFIIKLLTFYTNSFSHSVITEVGGHTALTQEEIEIGTTQGKLEVVKAFKNRTGCSLIEAKNTVESFFTQNNLTFDRIIN